MAAKRKGGAPHTGPSGSPADQKRQRSEAGAAVHAGKLDELFGQRSAFPVSVDKRQRYDPADPPTDVATYLACVRTEAEETTLDWIRQQENVSDASDTEESDEMETETDIGTAEEQSSGQDAPWREKFLDEFITLRQKVQDGKYASQAPAESKTRGEQEWNRILKSSESFRKFLVSQTAPEGFLDDIIKLNHSQTLQAVTLSTEIVGTLRPNDSRDDELLSRLSQWLFALLLRLPDVLDGSETSMVRELGKKCLLLRKKILKCENPYGLYQFVTDSTVLIVGRVFGQRDLLEDGL